MKHLATAVLSLAFPLFVGTFSIPRGVFAMDTPHSIDLVKCKAILADLAKQATATAVEDSPSPISQKYFNMLTGDLPQTDYTPRTPPPEPWREETDLASEPAPRAANSDEAFRAFSAGRERSHQQMLTELQREELFGIVREGTVKLLNQDAAWNAPMKEWEGKHTDPRHLWVGRETQQAMLDHALQQKKRTGRDPNGGTVFLALPGSDLRFFKHLDRQWDRPELAGAERVIGRFALPVPRGVLEKLDRWDLFDLAPIKANSLTLAGDLTHLQKSRIQMDFRSNPTATISVMASNTSLTVNLGRRPETISLSLIKKEGPLARKAAFAAFADTILVFTVNQNLDGAEVTLNPRTGILARVEKRLGDRKTVIVEFIDDIEK